MILFIASEVMFFVAWFWAYFNTALFPGEAHEIGALAFTHGVWPPKGIETFDPWHLPLLNTLILLTSGTTVTWAHHALLENDRQGLKWGLIAHHRARPDVYLRAGLRIFARRLPLQRQHLRRHLLHGDRLPRRACDHRLDLPDRVPGRARIKGHFTPTQHLGFEFAAWYWHFVDVVWLFLFACIYVWGFGRAASRSDSACERDDKGRRHRAALLFFRLMR